MTPQDARSIARDVVLARDVRAGDTRAEAELLENLETVVRSVSRDFYVPGSERSDLEQELRMQLVRAFRRWYDPERGTTPRTFANIVARRWAITLFKAEQRYRRVANISPTSLDKPIHVEGASDDLLLIDMLATVPLEQTADDQRFLQDVIAGARLTPLEHRCIIGLTLGASYAEIGGNPKTIDNALQRARAKLSGRRRDQPKRRRAA